MIKVNYEQLRNLLERLPKNPRAIASGNFASPQTLLRALDESAESFKLHMLNAQVGIPDRAGISYETAFVGPGMRRHASLNYIPSRLSMVPILFRDHYVPDVVLLNTSASRFGKVSLGTEVNILPAAIEAAKIHGGIVIAQVNSKMPYTFGDAELNEDQIDYFIEVDEPLETKEIGEVSDASAIIGDRIADYIDDGTTLQLGIGSIPDAVIGNLHKLKNLRVWSEMFSDGVLGLNRAGALDPEIPITASFVFGSQELYEWLNGNERVRMLRTETTNDPGAIEQQVKMTSINAALQVDLYDQANASYVRGLIYSGFGGSTDFIVGSLHARGGKSFMALPSWHKKANASTIVPRLGEHVTSFQHSHVVTEIGVADCFGHSEKEQATNLIERAAHPNARDQLREAAGQLGIL